ncbi:helix-turn-helix transcriptional regulator [Mesorhizobium silamurunense]|uniref:helix-turn-helix transcriptional regulator n=1 Tax=Mesorhizobium silamurunense TaxID=499528 RepID=UPI00177F54D3|nr:hypothetical protein [Mesorhizobium silamurunense]
MGKSNQWKIDLKTLSDDDLVDDKIACQLIGGSTSPIHRSTLWRGINAGRYPKAIKVAPGTNRWRVGELRRAIDQFAAERESEA